MYLMQIILYLILIYDYISYTCIVNLWIKETGFQDVIV